MLARIRREGDAYPFRETADTLSAADVAFANLEVPLTTVDAPTPGKDPESVRAGRDYVFRAPPRLATAIRDAGFDVVSLANNHAMDQGALGLAETTEALRKAGIEYVGAGRDELEAARPALTRTGGVTIAWLAASEVLPLSSVASAERAGIAASRGTHGGRDARAALLRRVRTLKAQGLVVIVSLHWGAEGQIAPTDAQRRLARALSSAGADALVGHHPHVLQGFAWMDRTFVAYSLGNFVASPRGRLARESAILELQIDELGVREARVRPVWIEDGQARLLSGAAAERQMSQIASISSLVGGVVRATGEVHAEQPARGRSQ
jgi:poly-gamma-glutamate synthesis protein (capsule biosynthesis protein)